MCIWTGFEKAGLFANVFCRQTNLLSFREQVSLNYIKFFAMPRWCASAAQSLRAKVLAGPLLGAAQSKCVVGKKPSDQTTE
jgi:hypothetical protein